ncbi:MAG: hypothetical protein ACM33B_13490 [Pseudomonadota bacterium]
MSPCACTHRRAALVAAALVSLAVAAGASARPDAAATVRFDTVPRTLVKGEPAAVTVAVRPGRAACTLSVRYAGGGRARLGATRAVGGRAEWRFRVPSSVPAGTARLTAACRGAGSRTTSVRVVARAGSNAGTFVVVAQSGFSQRWRGTLSMVSWGLVLENRSTTRDAVSINAVVNFVDASNRVVQTQTQHVAGIRAGARYYLGGYANVPEGIAVARLEVTGRHADAKRGTLREPPTEALRIVPQLGDPGFVGAVNGQVLNDHPRFLLSSAKISIVVFDAAGNITGGAQAYTAAALVPGARSYFSAAGGINAVPIANAVTVRATVEPTYAAG